MPDYPVFTSYAQKDRDRDLARFGRLFREKLRVVTGRPDADALIFFDRDGVEAGDRFSEKIVGILKTADVLICLMSPTYFTRPWCGRELTAFLERHQRVAAPARGVRFIFPIWWQPLLAPRPVPRRLSDYHYKDPQFPEAYMTLGLRRLARKPAQFERVVERLVELVAKTLAQPHRLPTSALDDEIETIPNAFDELQPYDVGIVSVAPGGDAWRPTADDVQVSIAAEKTAENLTTFLRSIETGAGLKDKLDEAKQQDQVILLVADAATPVDGVLKTINSLDLTNHLAVLLVDAGKPAVGLDAWLGKLELGACARAKDAGLLSVAGPGELYSQMQRLVDHARRRLQLTVPAARAEDPGLAERAKAQGISPDLQPNLAGPGGTKS
jgi:hypothetical protein